MHDCDVVHVTIFFSPHETLDWSKSCGRDVHRFRISPGLEMYRERSNGAINLLIMIVFLYPIGLEAKILNLRMTRHKCTVERPTTFFLDLIHVQYAFVNFVRYL